MDYWINPIKKRLWSKISPKFSSQINHTLQHSHKNNNNNNNYTIRAVHIATAQHTEYSFSAIAQAAQHNTINTYLLNIISLFVQMIKQKKKKYCSFSSYSHSSMLKKKKKNTHLLIY